MELAPDCIGPEVEAKIAALKVLFFSSTFSVGPSESAEILKLQMHVSCIVFSLFRCLSSLVLSGLAVGRILGP